MNAKCERDDRRRSALFRAVYYNTHTALTRPVFLLFHESSRLRRQLPQVSHLDKTVYSFSELFALTTKSNTSNKFYAILYEVLLVIN